MDTTKIIASPSKSNGCVASVTGECIAKTDRLIAAAPELLEACKELVASIEAGEGEGRSFDMALVAIRKAEG